MNRERKNIITNRLLRAQIPYWVAQSNSITELAVSIRQSVVNILYFLEGLTQQDIADYLNKSQATISRLMQNYANRRKDEENWKFLEKDKIFFSSYKSQIEHDEKNSNIRD